MTDCIRYTLSSALILVLGASILQCTEDEPQLEASLIGPEDIVVGGSKFFQVQIDQELTTDCGSGSASTTTTSSSSDSSSSSSSESSSDITEYSITSYIQFLTGQTLLMKFTYDEEDDSFRLTPTTTSVSTCPTTDYINCNGTTGVNPTCETTDNITCGGTDAFIFTSVIDGVTFQATTGTIEYEEGFTLDTDSGKVDNYDLSFDMISSSGAIFSGTIYCTAD